MRGAGRQVTDSGLHLSRTLLAARGGWTVMGGREAGIGEGEKAVVWTQMERGEVVSGDEIQDPFCKWRGANRTY